MAGCLADFDVCQQKVSSVFLNNPTKARLSVLAEPNFAYAKQLKSSPLCLGILSQKPLDENFPNEYSQKTDAEKAELRQQENQCKALRSQALYQALRYSYAYYHSSHLDGASSEIVLSGSHSIHESLQIILHLRQILHEHLSSSKQAK